MDFYINKGASLPLLKLKLISDSDLDYQKFNDMVETASITFSMISVDTGIFKIANVPARVSVQKSEVNPQILEYFIIYDWKTKDTSKTGSYRGEFKIDFLDPNCGSLIVPIREHLYIHIQDSITKTETFRL